MGREANCGDPGALEPGRPLSLAHWLRTLLPKPLTRGEERGALGTWVFRLELTSLTASGKFQAILPGSGRAGATVWARLEVSKTVLLGFVCFKAECRFVDQTGLELRDQPASSS